MSLRIKNKTPNNANTTHNTHKLKTLNPSRVKRWDTI